MIQPEPSLAKALEDNCSSCGQYVQPIVVDGNREEPVAAYHCSNGHVFFTEWQRSYTKKAADTLPDVADRPILTVPAPDYSTPVCKGCGTPLGSPHALSCPLAGGVNG